MLSNDLIIFLVAILIHHMPLTLAFYFAINLETIKVKKVSKSDE